MAPPVTPDVHRDAATLPAAAIDHTIDHVLKGVEGLAVPSDQKTVQAGGFYGDMNSIVVGLDLNLPAHSHPAQKTIDDSLNSLFLTHRRNELHSGLARAEQSQQTPGSFVQDDDMYVFFR